MSEHRRNLTAAGLLCLAAVFWAVGVMRGEHTIVWLKAVNLCMECIGLG